jgi:ABC-type antimicrobial peptide transport system permease subunit
VGGFASFAVVVALMGLFGGLSYSVAQRTREIGVRSALGATPGDIMALVFRQGSVLVLTGLAIGLGAAAASGRFLSAYLFGITTSDIATYGSVAAALAIVAAVACAIPAWRAARIDALKALRH